METRNVKQGDVIIITNKNFSSIFCDVVYIVLKKHETNFTKINPSFYELVLLGPMSSAVVDGEVCLQDRDFIIVSSLE